MFRYLLLTTLLTLATVATAQNTENRARDDLRYNNDRRSYVESEGGDIWYGAGAQLGFQGGNNRSFFQIGISPIVGYKLNNIISVGPRASIVYNSFRDDFFGIKDNYIGWSAGAFTRAKIFRGVFAHAEYSLVSDVDYFNNGTKRRTTRAIPFLGAGFSQGGGIGAAGFEIMVLFRLTPRETLNDSPYEFRSGLNYNF